MTAIWLFWD